jgi:hypothetical protein
MIVAKTIYDFWPPLCNRYEEAVANKELSNHGLKLVGARRPERRWRPVREMVDVLAAAGLPAFCRNSDDCY